MGSDRGWSGLERSETAAIKSSRLNMPGDSISDLSSEGNTDSPIRTRTSGTQTRLGPSAVPPSRTCLTDAKSEESDPGSSTSSPEDGDDEKADENELSDEEPDVFAPSAISRKRGHQTGLSITFSNTRLGKRGRSLADDADSDDDSERPTSKMSKMSGNLVTSDDDDDDDDDDYNAVDDISESEEEEDVEQLEEKMIIESEEDEDPGRLRRGSVSSTDSIFALENLDDSGAHLVPQQFLNEFFPEISNTPLQDEEDHTAPTIRRVRFAEEVQLHSSSSATETEEEDKEIIYPDLFLQQEALDPAFRKLIEQRDVDERSSDGDSYWDFENDQHGTVEELVDGSADSDTGSSGYETDEGETTDEEILPPRTVSKPQTSLRHGVRGGIRSKAPQTSASTPSRRGTAAGVRRGPLMGSFLIDEDKPIAVVDGHGKHMLFFPAPKHRRQAVRTTASANSPGPSTLSTCHIQSETESDVGYSQTDPMLSSPANVMMSGLTNNRNRSGSALSSEITGPPEAFFPFTSISSNGVIETDDVDDDTFEEYSDEEDNLRIEDFINFGEDSSSEEEGSHGLGQANDSNNTTGDDGSYLDETSRDKMTKIPGIKLRHLSTPTTVNPSSLLEHFDKGVVSSFRRNNDRHKSWTRSPANVGIKGSRLHAANALISPIRRRRGGSAVSTSGRASIHPQNFETTAASPAQVSQYQPFGGPLKRRISNSNHARRERKNTI